MNCLERYIQANSFLFDEHPETGAPQKYLIDDEVADRFPQLAELLRRARITPVRCGVLEAHDMLFAEWQSATREPMAWLSHPVRRSPKRIACDDHHLLLRNFGGVQYPRLNEPEESLALNAASFLLECIEEENEAFFDRFERLKSPQIEEQLQVSVGNLYCIAACHGGEFVFCDRATGRVWMQCSGLPWPESIPQISTFREWVEAVAKSWLKEMSR